MRFLGDSFICKFCASLEGHSFQGLHPTSQTEDKSAVPSMEQVIQGNNKCERQQHSLRGLNWIALTFYKATNCLSYSSAWVFAFWWAQYKDTLKFGSSVSHPIWTVSSGAGGKEEGQGLLGFPQHSPGPSGIKRGRFLKMILKEQGPLRLGPLHCENASTS